VNYSQKIKPVLSLPKGAAITFVADRAYTGICIMGELWRPIKDYENNYEVSNTGKIRNIKNKKQAILKPRIGNHGYYYINLSKNGVVKSKTIHRIVGVAFLCNKDEKKTINHKDGNKLNNNKNNLEWATYLENNRHAVTTGLMPTREVLQYDLQMNFINEFYSVSNAEKKTKVNCGGIWCVCNGLRNKAGNYIWKYK
jgi:hypothetical protein